MRYTMKAESLKDMQKEKKSVPLMYKMFYINKEIKMVLGMQSLVNTVKEFGSDFSIQQLENSQPVSLSFLSFSLNLNILLCFQSIRQK